MEQVDQVEPAIDLLDPIDQLHTRRDTPGLGLGGRRAIEPMARAT